MGGVLKKNNESEWSFECCLNEVQLPFESMMVELCLFSAHAIAQGVLSLSAIGF